MLHIVDGFTQAPEQSHALIRAIYRDNDGFAAEPDEFCPDLPAFIQHLAELESRPGALFLLARDADGPGAYLFIKPRPLRRLAHTADLNMGVAVQRQGQGLGQALLREALRQATAAGRLDILYLMVRADNAAALRLYRTAGFEQQACLKRDTRIGDSYFDGILMSRTLTAPEADDSTREP